MFSRLKAMALAIVTKAAPSSLTAPSGTVPVRGSMWGWVSESFAGAWQQGVTLNPIGSIVSFSPVYACISRISNDIAKLGLDLVEEQADGTTKPVMKASPYWQVLRRPNSFQNRIQWVAAWLISKLLYGNAYGLKIRDQRGIVTAIYILDPRRVTPLVTPDGDVYYSLAGDDLSRVPTGMVAPASEIIHDRMNCLWHPLVGVSPIYACALSATQGSQIQNNSSKFFENMSRPSGILTSPGVISDPTAKRMKEDWQANFGAGNLGKIAVMGDGLTYQAMQIGAEQSQMVEQLGWTVEDVARAFSMPAYKVGAGPMPTNNNVQALNQQYLDDCLQVHIEALELCMDEGLGVPDGYHVEFDLNGLLRMDSLTQMEVATKGVLGGVYKPNDGRLRMNLPPIEGGDTVYLQQQQFSLQALAKRDARDDPFAASSGSTAPKTEPAPPVKAGEEAIMKMIESLAEKIDKANAEPPVDRVKAMADELRAEMAALTVQARAPEGEAESDAAVFADALIAKFMLETAHVRGQAETA